MSDTTTPTDLREAVAATVREHVDNPHHPIGNLILALQLVHGLTVDEGQALDLLAGVFNVDGIADGTIKADHFLLPGERLYVPGPAGAALPRPGVPGAARRGIRHACQARKLASMNASKPARKKADYPTIPDGSELVACLDGPAG